MTPETAICAVHPGQPAYTTCARCGNFACSYCLADRDVCGACVARDEGEVISWERKDLSLLRRFWRTTRDVISRPTRALCEQRSSSTGAALVYALTAPGVVALMGLSCCLPFALLGVALRARSEASTPTDLGYVALGLAIIFGVGPLGVFAGALVRGAVFHVCARAAGGHGGFDASLRICAYMTAFVYVDVVGSMLVWIPVVGIVVGLLVLVADLLWTGRTLTAAARAHHGITDGRAAIAGWVPPTIYFVAGLLILAFFAFGQLSGGPAPDSYD